MNQYGIFAWFGYILPMKVRLKLIREAGFGSVMLWWGDEFADLDGDKTRHPDLARRHGLRVENAHAPYSRANDLWEGGVNGDSYEAKLAEHIQSCSDNGIPTLVIHPSEGPNPTLPAGEAGIQRLMRLLGLAARCGVTLALENMRRSDDLAAAFTRLKDEHLGFCYDCGHDFAVSGNLNLIGQYGHRLKALHLHDNDGSEDQHLVPGEGHIKWESLRSGLVRLKYEGALTLECCAPWRADMDESRREAPADYLRRAFDAVGRYFPS